MSKVKININLNREDKEKMEEICEKLGITMTGAINMFVKKMIVEEGIPFEVSTKKAETIDFMSFSDEAVEQSMLKMIKKHSKVFEELAK
ncbi:MAG: type II toxin-antitoxin system RelB/DinJ family antitoxin [Clostridiaceae bacterium]|nr:type II toxin-antitoxin system RelB/DinJ family antitoxin [Clostridiaceae bacterium]